MINQNFIYIGLVLNLFGTGIYVRDVLRGTAVPNRVSWFVLSVAPMIAFASMISQHVSLQQSLLTFAAGFSPLLIVIASFLTSHASWKIVRFDIACAALSLVGLFLWIITKEGNIAIVMSIAADGLAFLPTLIKSYKYPETESWQLFALGATNGAIALLIISKWDFAHAAFAVYLFLADVTATLLIKGKLGKRISGYVQKELTE